MGGRTFVLIYWCTQASVDETERASSSTSECRRNVNEIYLNLSIDGASNHQVLAVGLKKTKLNITQTESLWQARCIELYDRNQTNNLIVTDESK